jgi:serine O-acetyltransferase
MTLTLRIGAVLRKALVLLHPCAYGELVLKNAEKEIAESLAGELRLLCPDRDADELAEKFVSSFPEVKRLVESDVQAAYEGDPAATSPMEVVMSYPGLYAVTVHRLAHELYKLKIPVIPRIMSEIAHSKTGIDIHPGATIGERFFIDHGTGVVIGETTIIGRNVKIYQGVTLGAKSFAKDPVTGALVKGIKRHPNVEDNVVIYAGATILGGDTTIGHDSEIGGSVWLISSVPPNSRVYNTPPAPVIKTIDRA